MPSSRNRKKNKGKERKAKKEEAERVDIYTKWKRWANGEQLDGSVVTQCNHGLAAVPDISHPVSSFMHSYLCREGRLEDTIQKYKDLWSNDNYRKLAVQMLIRITATNLIGNKGNTDYSVILVLENYDETIGDVDDNYNLARKNRIVASKIRDIACMDAEDCRRDLLKFFRKRMNCKCLKKMHLEARTTMPKLGSCHHCGVEKERALLMVCSRCRIDQYCSRKCQVAASPDHREDCDKFVWAHEQTVANISG